MTGSEVARHSAVALTTDQFGVLVFFAAVYAIRVIGQHFDRPPGP